MKKTMKSWLFMGLVTLAAGMFTACSSSSDDGGSVIPIDPGYVPVTLPDGLAARTLAGIVKDTSGKPINGVTVKTGSVSVKTNAAGMFVLDQVQVKGNRIIVSFEKAGYFDLTRSCDTYQTGTWEVSLIAKNESGRSTSSSFGSATGKDIIVGATKVELPADGFKNEATGSNYSGNVNVDMAFISPDDKDFADAMPGGDLQAVRVGGDEAELLSYGMIAVSITDDMGNKLNLQDGKTAKVTFPIPTSLSGKTPETIPLWWFNEETGKWEEDGVAKLVGDHYEGEVKHFSWWNLDYPSQQGTVEGHVRNADGAPVANITVHVGQRTTKTNEFGYFRQDVPAGEDFSVAVLSKDYGNSEEAIEYVKALSPYEVRTVDLTLAKLYKIRGRLLQGDVPLIGAISLAYDGKTLPTWISNYDGTFEMFAPAKYTGAATLTITTAAGRQTKSISINNADVELGDIVFGGSVAGGIITITPSLAGRDPFTLPVPEGLTATVSEDGTSFNVSWQTEDYNQPGWNMFFVGGNEKDGGFFECIYFTDTFSFDTDRSSGSVKIVKIADGVLTFTFNGKCRLSFRGATDEVWDENAFYQTGELNAVIVEGDETGRW
ncbi:MAG: carboxypeptidase-like regulatory domain-containing protein [Bacteroidaceae bacterium]|nr:carboxypeptidase-like regulatory domain-containing protein [Bacteroidaceae bacterium]